MKQVYKVLVPTDFSSVSATALNHAIDIAKIMDGEIIVLHVIDKDDKPTEANKKLQPLVDEVIEKHNIPTVGKVVHGNIFEDINKVADYEGAKLIVMGTHGRRGIQHLIGSYAMKIITNSTIPFLVVQDKKSSGAYKNIVFPIDFNSETKLKISSTASMAKALNAKIHIFGEYDDDPFLKKNIQKSSKFLSFLTLKFTEISFPSSATFISDLNFTAFGKNFAISWIVVFEFKVSL